MQTMTLWFCWPFTLDMYIWQVEDFTPYFSGRRKLLPRHTDLSFYNWDTNHSSSNSTPNYQVCARVWCTCMYPTLIYGATVVSTLIPSGFHCIYTGLYLKRLRFYLSIYCVCMRVHKWMLRRLTQIWMRMYLFPPSQQKTPISQILRNKALSLRLCWITLL